MSESIDLSYKDRAFKITYDIECLESLYTVIWMHSKAVTLWFFGDHCYDYISDNALEAALKVYIKDPKHIDKLASLGVTSADDLDVNVVRFYAGDRDSMTKLRQELNQFILCRPFSTDEQYTDSDFVEYYGWNSFRYDLPLNCLTMIALSDMKDQTQFKPSHIRRLSNTIIGFNGPDWKYPKHMEEQLVGTEVSVRASRYKQVFHMALYMDGHVDLAKLARAAEGGEESTFPPALKKEIAKYGLDIIIDEMVGSIDKFELGEDEIIDLCQYNLNDVVGTYLVGQNGVIQASLQTRDIVRRMYPYTSARATPANKLSDWAPAERDCTAATLAGLVLIGPNRRKPQDWEYVQYLFPVPDKDRPGEDKLVDLFEYIKETEEFTHPLWEAFFDYFRGKDTRSLWDNYKVRTAQPITHSATMNVPYYRDGKPIDCYIRVSMGGAHGSVMAGLRDFNAVEVENWIRSDAGAADSEKPTIDLENMVHIDFASFYPVMASKMKIYMTSEGVDRYTDIIDYRVKIKATLPHDKALWTQEHHDLQEEQMGLKFILNNATGAGNMHNKWALLPIDNKTLSMRLIGNMLIWCLGQRLAQAGAYVTSTNTDGLYVWGITVEEAQYVLDGFIADYGMGVDPEIVDRFINRDTSSRIEYVGDHVQDVRGRLRHGASLHYTDDAINRNVPYPLVAAYAAIQYMIEDKEWLVKPYDRERLREIIQRVYEQETTPEPWYHVHVGSGKRKLTVNGVRQQKINRVVLTTDGDQIGCEIAKKLKKDEFYTLWEMSLDGETDTVEALKKMGMEAHESMVGADLSTLCFATKLEVRGQDDQIVDARVSRMHMDPSAFRATWNNVKCVGLAVKVDDELRMVESWKESTLTGYTSNTGVVLNTAESLEEFDLTKIDLEAYLRWAEQLLAGWKVTADIPEIGLVSVDDTVVEKVVKKRITKADRALQVLDAAYQTAYERIMGIA